MRKKKNIWILFNSRKGGHTYPSKALYDYIKNNEKNAFSPEIINLLDLSSALSFIDKMGRYGDLKLRWLFKKGYQNLQKKNQILIGSYRFAEGLLSHISKIYEKLRFRFGKPDIIISIQPEVNVIAGILKDWFSVPIHAIIIDLAIHGLWINKRIDHYYVANEPLKRELMEYGVDTKKIDVTGMPLRSAYSQIIKDDINQTRRRLQILPDVPTILLMGGLLGTMIDFHSAIKSVVRAQSSYQLLVVFGKNEKSKTRAESLKQKSQLPIHLYGTVSNMEEMMWASDIIVSKPGSITMAEALSLGKPMIAITPRAGSAQESRFAQFLKENGAGEWIDNIDDLGASINRIFNAPNTYKNMCGKAYELGHHSLNATEAIFNNIKRILK